MTSFIEKLEHFNVKIGSWVAWLTLVMVMVMFANVAMRYLFKTTLIWQQELVGFLHAIVFLAAAGYTLVQKKHVSVDILYQKFNARQKAWVELIGCCLFLIPMCFVISYFSYDFISSSWAIKEASAEYNGMPGVFILKSFLWVFCVTLLIQAIAGILKSIHQLRS